MTKMVNAKEFITLCKHADRSRFNRTINTERLEADIDPNGINLLEMVLAFHNDLPHHRAMCYIKVRDRTEPQISFLDISDEDWKLLKEAKEDG